METKQEYAVTTTEQSLAPYGSRGELKELGDRIKRFLPNGAKLSADEALALAQVAMTYGLNPFNGEVWFLKDKDGRSSGTMVGVKGLRKAARKQAPYQILQRDMDKGEREARGLSDRDAGLICECYRIDIGIASQRANIPFIGEGVARTTDRLPATKTLIWLADKRAEADALKKAFDLPFGFSEMHGNGENDIIDGSVTSADDKLDWGALEALAEGKMPGEQESDAPAISAQQAADELFGAPAPERRIERAKINAAPAVDDLYGEDRPKSNGRADVSGCTRWAGAMDYIGQKTAHYIENGVQNPWHLLTTAKSRLGYDTITNENVEEVAQKLIAYGISEDAKKAEVTA